jgi:gamma-glutamylcyclotransferase (GGCT)/AIG2-like uncharacterized protein YtfP
MRQNSRDLLAVYGTLRRRSIFQKLPEAVPRLCFVGYGRIRGRLFWQRTFPALIHGPGIVGVELFEIIDPGVWPALDFYEGFDSTNPSASWFVRRQTRLVESRLIAWTYFLNRPSKLGFPIRRKPGALARNPNAFPLANAGAIPHKDQADR